MVMTIAAVTSPRYYTSIADEYAEWEKAQGVWVKVGVPADFRPGDAVDPAEFERLHAALDHDGKFLLANDSAKIARTGGYDVTFSAPKSVSVCWMRSGPALCAGIEQAQAQAVAHALDVLEGNAAFCRFGKGGATRLRVALTVATFLHGDVLFAEYDDAEEFPDPDLHTHAVILNLAHEGCFRALEGKLLFAWKSAAAAAYHHALANSLWELGFEIESTGENGLFEIVGAGA